MLFRPAYTVLSVSAVALAVGSTCALGLGSQATPNVAQGIENLDLNDSKQFHFSVHLTTQDAATVALVQEYFAGFGFQTSYLAGANAVHLTGTLNQAQAAGHFSYKKQDMGANHSIGRLDRKPSFTPAIDAVVANHNFGGIGIRMIPQIASTAAAFNNTIVGFTPADVARLYNLTPISNRGIDGTGQTVYLFDCGYIAPSDLEFFDKEYNLPGTTDTNFLTQTPVAGDTFGSYYGGEPTLDVERVHATAPGARIKLFSLPQSCFLTEWVDVLDAISADIKANGPGAAVSVSYALPEGLIAYFANYYSTNAAASFLTGPISETIAAIVATGTPVFGSSGDDGSIFNEPLPNTSPLQFGFLTDVEYPASDPNVISVGGTTLMVDAQGGRVAEWAWSGDSGGANAGGSGGGISVLFPTPTWQLNVAGASLKGKNLPDVSLVADPFTGYAAYSAKLFGGTVAVGGTSASSPTWAGFMALVEQGRVNDRKKPLAKVVNKLYSQQYDFNEILVGANGDYTTGPGYNNVTGLGVPNFGDLYLDLKELP
jgi:kumamolisin